ncbi:hypothetical protein FKF97_10930 [Clostridium perfringens]|nr:hypothetical protein [Clostridium perfringens]
MDIDFENLEELLNKTDNDIKKVAPLVGEDVGDLVHKNTKQMVYEGDFQPNYYIRRGKDGGYGDRRNIIVTPLQDGIVCVENIAKGNESEPYSDAQGKRLDEIIEYGEDYTWNRQPPPRPVFEFTEEELKTGLLEEIYKGKLKDMGYELK